MSSLWHFSITNNDDTSNLDEATEILDVVMAYHSRANEIFYGFRQHGEGFTIEGFVDFGVDMVENEVQDLLPGFEVRMLAFIHDAICLCDELCHNCIYTKHGVAWDHDYIEFVVDQHDNNLDEDHNQNA